MEKGAYALVGATVLDAAQLQFLHQAVLSI
jgi:hypothetical protein